MKKSMIRGMLSRRRLIAVFLSLSFILGTVLVTYAQAAKMEQSATVKIYDDDKLVAYLTIRHYTVNPNFAVMHALLKITNNYEDDIYMEYLSVESWSDDKTETSSVMYGKATKGGVTIAAGETVVFRINVKAYHFSELITDDDVWSYTIITWTHAGTTYSEADIAHTDAYDVWHQLYP
ncbi:MAG: hypothetical protein ACE5IO_04285 [Thermoplasmata archaeon]